MWAKVLDNNQDLIAGLPTVGRDLCNAYSACQTIVSLVNNNDIAMCTNCVDQTYVIVVAIATMYTGTYIKYLKSDNMIYLACMKF